jgi:hypothetical protein
MQKPSILLKKQLLREIFRALDSSLLLQENYEIPWCIPFRPNYSNKGFQT